METTDIEMVEKQDKVIVKKFYKKSNNKYNRRDIEHFEILKAFFNHQDYIDGEHPFYVDDRVMDGDDGTVKLYFYRGGKRSSNNIPPAQFTCESNLVKDYTVQRWKDAQVHTSNSFITFVVNNWGKFLTFKQKDFMQDVLTENEDSYSKQLRYKYRINIQNRLKRAYIGVGGDNTPAHMLSHYKNRLNMVAKFIDASDDNIEFTSLLKEKMGNDFINDIVYSKMKKESRQMIVDCKTGKRKTIEIEVLSEFLDFILDEDARLFSMGLA